MSGWWRAIVEVTSGTNGDWFHGNLERVIGERICTYFWDYIWIGDEALKITFPRLYNISLDKEGKVGSFGFCEGGIWKWNLRWR